MRLSFEFLGGYKKWVFIILFLLISLPMILAQELSMVEKIAQRITGPFHMRFVFQPLFAVILGVRDGINDAKTKTPPYIFEMFKSKTKRKENLKKGVKALTIPLSIGIILDIVVQYNLFHDINWKGALIVGILVIGLPYALSRGITNRLKSIMSRPGK